MLPSFIVCATLTPMVIACAGPDAVDAIRMPADPSGTSPVVGASASDTSHSNSGPASATSEPPGAGSVPLDAPGVVTPVVPATVQPAIDTTVITVPSEVTPADSGPIATANDSDSTAEPAPSVAPDPGPFDGGVTDTVYSDSGISEEVSVSGNDSVDQTQSDQSEAGQMGGSDCPHSGTVVYTFNNAQAWPSDVIELLTAAMDEAVYYYNCYSDLSHNLTVNYNESVPTAEANVDGWISFGSSRAYMVVATAMHEIGHTMGVGYSPWNELFDNGRWTGASVSELMSALPADERDPDMYSQRDYITGDAQHFWPYGLNQASEHQSEWSLVNHVRIVAAMQRDKAAYRNSGNE